MEATEVPLAGGRWQWAGIVNGTLLLLTARLELCGYDYHGGQLMEVPILGTRALAKALRRMGSVRGGMLDSDPVNPALLYLTLDFHSTATCTHVRNANKNDSVCQSNTRLFRCTVVRSMTDAIIRDKARYSKSSGLEFAQNAFFVQDMLLVMLTRCFAIYDLHDLGHLE
ncbi:hypothetical protein DACRYDRAFT_24666, partial [Dacryopinax primogenitus]